MKKLLLILLTTISMMGCTTIRKDVTNDPKYKSIIERTYQTKDDFVVFKHDQRRDKFKVGIFNDQGLPSRDEIKAIFPYQYESNVIYGILPKGSRFKVIKVTYMNNFETTQIYYSAEILSDGPFKGKTIDVSLLTGAGDVPQFLEKYAVEVEKAN